MPRSLEEILAEKMLDPGFAREYKDSSIRKLLAVQVIRMRQDKGLTQQQLANMVGTRQSSISRLEDMQSLPSLSFLMKVAEALDADVDIRLTRR